jgi:hypothetical protein
MSNMSLELYSALQEAGVTQVAARRVADAVDEAIDKRYAIHARELATRGDIELVRREVEGVRKEVEGVRRELAEGIKNLTVWLVGVLIAATALIVSIIKMG